MFRFAHLSISCRFAPLSMSYDENSRGQGTPPSPRGFIVPKVVIVSATLPPQTPSSRHPSNIDRGLILYWGGRRSRTLLKRAFTHRAFIHTDIHHQRELVSCMPARYARSPLLFSPLIGRTTGGHGRSSGLPDEPVSPKPLSPHQCVALIAPSGAFVHSTSHTAILPYATLPLLGRGAREITSILLSLLWRTSTRGRVRRTPCIPP